MHKYATIPFLIQCVILSVGCTAEEEGQDPPARAADEPMSKQEAAEHKQSGKADLPFDLCKKNGWYDDDECDWFCSDHDPVCHAEPLGEEPAGRATRYPVVLLHGFNAGRTGSWSFYRVQEALEADGHDVYAAEVHAFASTQTRALALATQIDALLARQGAPDKVNLVAHSMGGLDARYLVSELGYGDRVASVTTISSPHHGSAVADVALRLLPEPADELISDLATIWSTTFNAIEEDADVRAALTSLSTPEMERFNAQVQDDSRVYYQSWAGVSSVLGLNNGKDEEACEGLFLRHPGQSDVMNKLLWPMAAILAPGLSLTPNDGMSTVASARWGEFRGCIPADHYDEVGQIRRDGADTHTGFDHVRFYRNVAFDLAERGY